MTAAQILSTLACGAPGCPCAQSVGRGFGLTHCPAHEDEHPTHATSVNTQVTRMTNTSAAPR